MNSRIILAGGSGFLGGVLANYFSDRGWEVVILTRQVTPAPSAACGSTAPRPASPSYRGPVRSALWDGLTVGAWQSELEDATALINLSGKSVNCRYTPGNRRQILDSRINSTRVLGEAIGRCSSPPPVWLNASTATIYKHTLGDPNDEAGEIAATPEAKDAFSIEVGQAWERALNEARTPRTRKVAPRMTMVLGLGQNSVFPVLRRLVRFGLGGKMGRGNQFVSWIHELDFCRALEWLIAHDNMAGPINLAAPNPITNREMMRTLRRVYGVPFRLPATRWMLEVGAWLMRTETELIIKSRRAIPRRLLESGFDFRFPTIQGAFENLAARKK